MSVDAPENPLVFYLNDGGVLGADAGPDRTVTVQTAQDCGADCGEYFPGNATVDLPGDQHADDGLSQCFETAPLAHDLEVIGQPVLRVPISINAPQGNVIARLMDVHPDGTAHRVSLGILNLSHRRTSATPAPMTPGVEEEVCITLDATGYGFLAGHRLRLAISTAYFPYILPAPTAIEATLRLGSAATLELPQARTREIVLAELASADASRAYPTTGTPGATRDIVRRGPDGQTRIQHDVDSGEITHPESGLVWRETRQSIWSILPDAPTSMVSEERKTVMRRRDGVQTDAVGNSAHDGDRNPLGSRNHITGQRGRSHGV